MGKNTLTEEHFASIPGYPNYQVSNYGRVINSRGMELRPRTDALGYQNVALYNNRVRRDVVVHRLVAEAFFVDYDVNLEVKHKNEDHSDNSVLNLTLGPPLRIKVRIKETGREFESLEACGRYLGGKAARIHEVLTGKRDNFAGYTFEVLDRQVKS
jgi:hypothetical protein